jgi:ATP-dependent DNA helicase RecG
MDFLKKHLNVRAEINGPTRIDIPEIPIDALREIIANAIIHRDYTMSGTNIQVEIHEDRIVVFNPGGLPEDFAANMLGKKTFRRNEIVADFFQRMGKVESLGSGIRRINQSLSMAGLRPAEFEVDTFFTVTLWRQVAIGTTQKKTTQKKTTQKKTTQKTIPKDILEILIKSPTATRQEIAHLLGDITADGVKYYLLKLQKNKTIKREGPDKGGRWKVLKEVNDD